MAAKKILKAPVYAAAVSLGLFFAGEKLSNDSHEGSEKSRWKVKVLADDEVGKINFKPEARTIHWLVSQPTEPFHEKKPRENIEKQVYKVECNIAEFLYEDDGDVHLVLCDKGDTMVGEIPFPYYPTAAGTDFQKKYISARTQFHQLADPGNYAGKRVVITGVGFVDKPHGQTGSASNNLELHPVLSIELKKKK